MRGSEDPEVRRLLGVDPGLGESLGLDEAWAARIIEQVGNYGEIFERNLGQETPPVSSAASTPCEPRAA